MARRVVITGMGWVTPLGTGLDEVWQRLLRAETAMGPVTRYDASTFATNFAAEVKGFDLARELAGSPHLDWHAHAGVSTGFALAAAKRAWEQSRLAESIDPRRVGIYLGAGEGSLDFEPFVAANVRSWQDGGVSGAAWAREALVRMTREREVEQEPHLTLTHVASELGLRGPAFNCVTACAASTQSVGEAMEIIRRGDAEAMLAGGSHSMVHPLGMTGFIRLTAMSKRCDDPKHAARPFDATRDGFVMGEGAGMLVLEELEHALKRGAEPLAELVGYGSSADAYRITDITPDGRGAQGCMNQALRQAGISPREPGADGRPQVHYISAHGTGTKENDSIETKAVKSVFGPMAPNIPFSSVKSMLGHLIQAAGAVELMTCVMAIRTGWAPPTANLRHPDPACDLDYVPNAARDLNPNGGVEVAISNGFGFGGQNDCVCVRRFVG
ncbi:MAG: beta-ketoacyl-[acyl-carrier-protein] synthase family protein [Phycisphaerales bacterium]|jgi:3-oxoacyl-[acyl-carrier-protein] synthase II|nr:beta-ketoacyl-[acyl-carrier-protein] synthase family protein [Phycisphaerales bacterium]